jgi:biotin transport system substrate-specific component
MNHPTPVELAPAAPSKTTAEILRAGGIVLAGTLFVAACSHISVPLFFTPVPLTLQPFAVLVLGLLLGPRIAFATLAAYLAEGVLGLPVFAPSAVALSGPAHLFGPTGGYLLAYPLAAALIASLWRSSKRGFGLALLSAAAGDVLILACGAVWLALMTHGSATAVISQTVLPFLPGEALKIAAAAGLAAGANRLRRAN